MHIRLLSFFRTSLVLAVLLGGAGRPAAALQGLRGAHDPSTIIKAGNTYWVFATGQGISSLSSTDLVNWTPGPAVFLNNAYPGWINGKVPNFAGFFWAPECVFQNGKYYLYYSCSTFGSRVSAIGLAINATLDPRSPDYRWVDQGVVIATNNGSAVNAIDPAIFHDDANNLWLTYGSYSGGIRITQLDAATGKWLGLNQYAVANSGSNGVEASYVKQHGSYYYLFVNRGTCCQGSNSTYYIQVGRSLLPGGPFLDKRGLDLNSSGGTTVLAVSGRYVGPGHTGILEENGVSYFSHHYYDAYDNGAPKLGIAALSWDAAGWPVISRDWVQSGRYTITNQNSGLLWAAGCTNDPNITQSPRSGQACQQWDFTALGNGEYKVANAQGSLAASVVNCSDANGALLQLDTYGNNVCQQYRINRASDGSLVFESVNGDRVVEVPLASTQPGAQLGLFDYNGFSCQHWLLSGSTPTATTPGTILAGVSIYPVPVLRGNFTLALSGRPALAPVTVEVFNLQGRSLYLRVIAQPQTTQAVAAGLPSGLFLVQVRQGTGLFTQKLPVL